MSHKATNWLSEVPPGQLGNSEFRVLFHLCDCHNPSHGCFPTQTYLAGKCGISRSTLNVALASLEEKGLIQRHQSIDEVTRRQRPTRYILGFELKAVQDPCPETGHGNTEPCPVSGHGISGADLSKKQPSRVRHTGHGAVSGFDPEPCPENGKSRVRPTGHKPVSKPVNNPRAREAAPRQAVSVNPDKLALFAEKLRGTGFVAPSAIRPIEARQMLADRMVSEADLKRHGISW